MISWTSKKSGAVLPRAKTRSLWSLPALPFCPGCVPSMRIRLLIVTLARSQALEAHGELTWGAVEFDNKMETLSVARRQKLNRANNKKKRKKVRPCATLTTGTGTEPTHEPCVLGWGLGRR